MKKIKALTVGLALTAAVLVLGGCGTSAPAAADKATTAKVFKGDGVTSVFRVGPGKDANGVQKYSYSNVTASALFDKDGKIIDVTFDGLEVVSPNGAKPGAITFAGWPTQAGYAGAASNTDETATKELSNWKTKRERGDAAYGMNWSVQFDKYQEFFKGKTVAEIEQWYAKNTSDLNGRPLKKDSKDAKEQEKYAKLSDAEKTVLADVTSGATISLNDNHGDFIGALKKAFENKKEVTIPAK